MYIKIITKIMLILVKMNIIQLNTRLIFVFYQQQNITFDLIVVLQ